MRWTSWDASPNCSTPHTPAARPKDGRISRALLPHEAHELLQLAPGARLIDVRSRAELELTGTLPGAVHVEWQSWPGWVINPHFSAQLAQAVDPESLLFFICRSGPRSHRAAIAGTEAGLSHCYNVLEGFEGDLDKNTRPPQRAQWLEAARPALDTKLIRLPSTHFRPNAL